MKASAIAGLGVLLAAVTVSAAEDIAYEGDVTDIRIVRRLEQHPHAWKIWQPFIVQGDRRRDLLVAFGVQVNGKNDMGDILVSLSGDDGDTWQEPVVVFDHRERQGSVQFAYANPVLYRARARTSSGASPCAARWFIETARSPI